MPKKPGGKPSKPKSQKPIVDPVERQRQLETARTAVRTEIEKLSPGQIRFLKKWAAEGNESWVEAYAGRIGIPPELRPLFLQMIEKRNQ